MYADGFVIPVPKDRLDDYLQMARDSGAVWREYGALEFRECVADDVPVGELTSFPRSVQLEDEETVIFSWIVYESREERDRINEAVMQDSRVKAMMESGDEPLDPKRMIFGGFEVAVDA